MKKTFSISEAISFGWNTFKSNWKFWIVVSLIVGMSAGSPGFSYTRNINKSKSTNTATTSKITYQNLPNTPLPVDFNKVLGVSTVNEKLPISDKELSPIIIFLLIPFVIVTAVGFLAFALTGVLVSFVFRMGYINLTLDAVRNKDVYYKTILNQVSLKKARRFLIAGLKVLLIILPFILLSLVPLYIILSVYFISMLMSFGGWGFSDLSLPLPICISWFLLFFIPGIILALKYSMVPFVLVDLDKTPSEAMKMSRKLTKNVKFKLLGFWFVCGLVMMLGLLVFGVGVIPASIVVSLAHAYVYNKLLEQSEPAVIPESPVLSPTPTVEVPLPSSNEVPSVNSGNLLAENQTLDDSLSINSEN
ncbi:MAG TPA: DUF975 family protein [bacterium]|nr:DUF975 family protein [bacterium]